MDYNLSQLADSYYKTLHSLGDITRSQVESHKEIMAYADTLEKYNNRRDSGKYVKLMTKLVQWADRAITPNIGRGIQG